MNIGILEKQNLFTLFQNEKSFQLFLLEILPKFNFENIIYNHGINEKGKDIIAQKINDIGISDFYSFVVKHNFSAKKNADISNAFEQVEESFFQPYQDTYHENTIYISKVIIISNSKFTANLKDSLKNDLRLKTYKANTFFWDRDKLIGLIDKYYPEYWNIFRDKVALKELDIEKELIAYIHKYNWRDILNSNLSEIDVVKIYSYLCEHIKNSPYSKHRDLILEYINKFDLVKAEELLLKDIETLNKVRKDQNELSSLRFFELAKIKSITGKFEEAKKNYKEAIELDKNNTDALSDYALLLNYTDNKDTAIEILNEAYTIDLEQNGNKDSIKSLTRKVNKCLCLYKSDPHRAVAIAKDLEKQSNSILDPQHYLFIVIKNILILSQIEIGDFVSARSNSEIALYLSQKIKSNRETIASINNFGKVLIAEYLCEKDKKNDSLIREALSKFTMAYMLAKENNMEDYDETDVLISNIGVAHYYLKEYDKAIEYYTHSLKIQLRKFGEFHHKVANRYNNLGNCHAHLNNFEQALDCLEKSLKINIKVLKTEQHIEIAKNYLNIGAMYLVKGDEVNGTKELQKTKHILNLLKIRQGVIIDALKRYEADYNIKL